MSVLKMFRRTPTDYPKITIMNSENIFLTWCGESTLTTKNTSYLQSGYPNGLFQI